MMKAEEKRLHEAEQEAVSSEIVGLAGYVHSVWADALESKDKVEDIMDECIMQRNGIYTDSKLNKIREQGGSEIFMMLTDEKCTALKAWLYDLLLPPNDKPYTTEPTPVPEIPEEQKQLIEQQAQSELMQSLMMAQQLGQPISQEEMMLKTNELMAEIKEKVKLYAEKFDNSIRDKIDDMVVEGGWREAFAEVIDDIVDLPAGILKGPIVEYDQELSWQQDTDGKYIPVVDDGVATKFYRVSPYDIFPVGASTGINDGDLFERHRLTIKQLEVLKNTEGYDADLIDSVILDIDSGKFQNWLDNEDQDTTSLNDEQEHDKTTDDWQHQYGKKVEVLQFWGAIPGHMLIEYGVDIEKEDLLKIFDAEVWVIGEYVIKAKLNANPLGLKPYYKASFRKRNGSFWGEGLPQILRDIQDMCNASARAIVNNMAIASGPQVGVDIGKIPEGETITSLFPWKIWQFDESQQMGQTGGRPPLWFFQPESNVQELMAVYEFFSKEADNKSGVPRYSYGSGGSAGALSTATGMTMMMNNAGKGIKQVVKNIDNGIIAPSIQAIHTHIMLWDEDESIKGDVKVSAKGSSALIAKEQQQVRLNEAMQIAMSEIGLKVLGEEKLAILIKEAFKGLGPTIESIVPSEDEIRQRKIEEMQQMMQAQQQQQQPQIGGVATDGAGNVAGGADVNAYQQMPR